MEMRIAIHDTGVYFALIERLTREGHDVFLTKVNKYIDPTQRMVAPGPGTLTYLEGTDLDLVHQAKAIDLLIGSEILDGMNTAPYLGIPYIGHSMAAAQLEADRELAFRVVRRTCSSNDLRTPAQHVFVDHAAAVEFLQDCDHDVVLKQHANSPLESSENRTVISRVADGHKQALHWLQQDANPWFAKPNDRFVGGCVFEDFIQGEEVCFGRMFNGERFVGQMYMCQEHKDAQNGGRSGILTGEVGTTITWSDDNPNGKMARAFRDLERTLRHVGAKGMVDINTIIDSSGIPYLVEFTMRWGRPTMDIQAAVFEGNYGNFLRAIAVGGSGTDHGKFPKNAMGVVVYNYGIPFYHGLPSVTFTMPSSAACGAVVPFLSVRDSEGQYHTLPHDGRNLVSVGFGDEISDCRKIAYSQLQNFSMYGGTWRDDIGNNWNSMINAVSDNIILTGGL
jgi:phosphoribosylamine-glycine ligase